MAKKVLDQRFKVLSIETSCDETSVALLDYAERGTQYAVRLRHHETATQIPIHRRFGGVVPEVAARTHVAELVSLLDRAKIISSGKRSTFDAIAVTKGPGLATALRVGVEAARTLAMLTGKPIVGVNHLEGHLASAWLVPENRRRWEFPILALLVSGGHSELVLMRDFCSYKVVGRTRDDAAGEAFDKTAKLLGLPYPGGPEMSKQAKTGNPKAFDLPRPMLKDKSLDMSFSGLKTAVRVLVDKLGLESKHAVRGTRYDLPDLCASIQAAITDVLVEKTIRAAKLHRPKCIIMVGGVSANSELQEKMARCVKAELPDVRMLKPPSGFYTDNAAMIAAAGLWRLRKGKTDAWKKLDAEPELDL
ncbi:tRNA (adenosine(37)-N6)-threonylcarbamoyltransferase complex transferase subunit TsaD [Candidatus Uhrbacteria bacterium]|nr:tRNA (adenosine(37)-N6)-threonylcarbamoyltransferase complex transferase subunit TsaD [Candidatus Uhrbacteria bacterium]